MRNSSLRRGIRATALALLTLAGLAGCGKGVAGGPTDPGPSDPGPSDPGPSDPGPSQQGPAPVGEAIYAVDLANNFLVFGSGSINVLSAKMKITGLPILKRIIGIAIRPSDGALIGVGNDSRIYTIDPLTADATPVSSGPFSPKISDFFDIHFAMALEPNGQRVRLIAAESGGNWSINITDGTAILEESSRYAAGALAGQTPRLLGLVYPTLSEAGRQPGMCENLAYALDADEAIMIASCDPATGKWWPTGESSEASTARAPLGKLSRSSLMGPKEIFENFKDLIQRCGEIMQPSPSAESEPNPGEPAPQEGEDWSPEKPDEPWYVVLGMSGTPNRVGTLERIGNFLGINWQGQVPSVEPVQSTTWVHPKYESHPVPPPDPVTPLRHKVRKEVQFSVGQGPEPEPSTLPAPPSDPRARCS